MSEVVINRRQRQVLRWLRNIGPAGDGHGVTPKGIEECVKLGLVKLNGSTVELTDAGRDYPVELLA